MQPSATYHMQHFDDTYEIITIYKLSNIQIIIKLLVAWSSCAYSDYILYLAWFLMWQFSL